MNKTIHEPPRKKSKRSTNNSRNLKRKLEVCNYENGTGRAPKGGKFFKFCGPFNFRFRRSLRLLNLKILCFDTKNYPGELCSETCVNGIRVKFKICEWEQ